MKLLGIIENYPWGREEVSVDQQPLPVDTSAQLCDHCGKDFPTEMLYVTEDEEGAVELIAAPCLEEFSSDAKETHKVAMSIRATLSDLVSPVAILGTETNRVLSYALDYLGAKPDTELTPTQQGWVLLCRFPTIRSAHAPHLFDIWGEWLSFKPPEVDRVASGKHLGAVGERVESLVTVTRINGPFAGEYGDSYMCVMETEDKDTLVWWTGENLGFDEGKKYKIRGTVKKHDVFNGQNQTHVSRVKEIK